jgi:putative transposase
MKDWLSPRELAAAKLPHVPQTTRGIQLLAEREGWDAYPGLARNRAGRGGGMEYSTRLLPDVAQIEWRRRHMTIALPAAPELADDEPATELSDRATQERDARLAIVQSFELWSRGLTLRLMSRLQIYSDGYQMGTIKVDPWVKTLVPSFSKRSLQRWIALVREKRTDQLGVDRGQARKGTGVLDAANDGKVQTYILALITHQPHLAAHDVRDQVEAEFGSTLLVKSRPHKLPPVRAFQRVISGLKTTHKVAITKATNPDLYRSTMAPAGTGTLRHIREPNALWMIDASPVDVLCTDGRYSMYGCIDIATRRFIITISKTPRASAVALLLRKAILAWGVPQAIKTDNGSDFVARDTKRLFAAIGIEMDVSHAYSPQEKGHIERAIRTFQHNVGPLLPGFIGHSVADRKAIESRKSFAARLGESEAETFGVAINSIEMQGYVDQWLDLVYQHRPHAGLKGQTPFLKAAESTAPIRRVDERALDLLLMPAAGKDGQRITTKFGVRIDGFHYQTPTILPGVAVFVRMDPMDAGRAYCFAADGAEFLGESFCAEMRGINPSELQRLTRETHNDIMDRATAGAKADIRRLGKKPLIEAALRIAAAKAPNVVVLPKREETHSTPQIAAAIAAMAPQSSPALSQSVSDLHADLMAELGEDTAAATPRNVTQLRASLTPAQLYRRALEIEARLAAGAEVETDDVLWLGGFQLSAAYRTQKEMHEEFGDQALR